MLPLERSARLQSRLTRALREGSVSHDPEFDVWTVTLGATDYHVQKGYLVSAKIGNTIDTWGSGVPLPKKVLSEMARKAVRIPLREGDTYEVVKPGASLSTLDPSGVGSWSPREIPLAVGDVIWYKGRKKGFGDSPSLDTFEDPEANEVGEFKPNSWGAADQSYLKNLDFEAMLRHLVGITDPEGANDVEAEAYALRIADMYGMDVMDVYDLAAGQWNAASKSATDYEDDVYEEVPHPTDHPEFQGLLEQNIATQRRYDAGELDEDGAIAATEDSVASFASQHGFDVADVNDALGTHPKMQTYLKGSRKVAMRWVEETGVWAATPDEEHALTVEMADTEDPYMIEEIERIQPESYDGERYIWTIGRDTELLAGGFEDSVSVAKAQAEKVFEDTVHGGVTALENIEEELHSSLGEYGWDIGPAEQHGYMVRDDSRNRHLFVTNGHDKFIMTIQDVNR